MLADTRKRWFVLAILWAVIMVIGITGFVKQGSAEGVNRGTFDNLYLTPSEWQRKAILNIAGMGSFSSDRTIREYAIDTWNMGHLLRKG